MIVHALGHGNEIASRRVAKGGINEQNKIRFCDCR